MNQLVLELFPGISFFGEAFEREGFPVVRGPDVLWGGDIRRFHPPAERFDGVIGGPPCQMFSALAPLIRHNGHEPRFGNLIPEFERVVAEAAPAWFVMENVRGAPLPNVPGYDRWSTLLKDSDVGGVQPRVRRISMGFREGLWDSPASPFTLVEYEQGPHIAYEDQLRGQSVVGDGRAVPVKVGGSGKRKRSIKADALPTRREARTVTGNSRTAASRDVLRNAGYDGGMLPGMGSVLHIGDMLEAQGLPRDYLDAAPFTVQGKRQAIGNGVPIAMGRAIARAVKLAIANT